MVAGTLAAYLTVYGLLLVAYVTVLKYMAEKPEEVLALDAVEQAVTPAGASTSAVLPAGSTA